jgi:hypothetical protein
MGRSPLAPATSVTDHHAGQLRGAGSGSKGESTVSITSKLGRAAGMAAGRVQARDSVAGPQLNRDSTAIRARTRAGRKLAGAFGAVAAAMVMTIALAGTAMADTGFGSIEIVNTHSNHKCLDVRAQDGYYSPGARVQQWDCSGVPEQQWQLHPYATVPSPYNPAVSVTLFQIQSERSGLCMEVGGGGIHALVRQNNCGTGSVNDIAHQLFISVPLGQTSFRYLRPWSSPSLCLDVQNGSGDNGNLLQQYPCTGGRNQQFYGLPLITS